MFLISFVVVWNLVDFSTPAFDPLREQWEVSIVSNPYYQSYILPVHDRYVPVVSKIRDDFIVPVYSKTSELVAPIYNKAIGVIGSKYQVLLGAHVDNAINKFTSSPIYLKYGEKVTSIYNKSFESGIQFTQLAFEKLAIYSVKGSKSFKIFYAKALNESNKIGKQLEAYSTDLLVLIKTKVIPTLHKLKNDTIKYSIFAFEKIVEYSNKLIISTKSFYSGKINPFISKNIIPKINLFYSKFVEKHYNAYLQPYVILIKAQITKYYNLLRVNEILSLSKDLLNSSYKELDERFSEIQDEETPVINIGKPLRTYKDVETEETTTDVETEYKAAETKVETTEASTETKTDVKHVEVKKDEDNAEVVLSLGDEISNWEYFINETILNIFKNFEISIEGLEEKLLTETKPQITEKLQNLSRKLQLDYIDVNKVIYNIDSHPAILENGEPVELDKGGKIIDHRISRQEFRDLLAIYKDFAAAEAENIQEFLTSKIKELENDIDVERKLIIDIYEEFAEVSITEFSKKMMYSTYSNKFNKISNAEKIEDSDSENFKDWKQYIKVKNYLIEQRDALIKKQTELAAINKYIFEIQSTLKTFIHESGSYYAILRAKANIEFQEREGREKHNEEEELDETTTIVKVITQTIDNEGNVTPQAKPVEEEPTEETQDPAEGQPSEEVEIEEPIEEAVEEAADTEDLDEEIVTVKSTTTIVKFVTETIEDDEITTTVGPPVKTTIPEGYGENETSEEEETVETTVPVEETLEEIKEEIEEKINQIKEEIDEIKEHIEHVQEEEQKIQSIEYDGDVNVHQEDEDTVQEEDDIVQHQPDQ